jgi:hypothetical protein
MCQATLRKPITGIAGCRARHERPCYRRAAQQRDKLASSQRIELHSVPAARVELQDINLSGQSAGRANWVS